MRVVVVYHKTLHTPLKAFAGDNGDGWDRAKEWVEQSRYNSNVVRTSSMSVHE